MRAQSEHHELWAIAKVDGQGRFCLSVPRHWPSLPSVLLLAVASLFVAMPWVLSKEGEGWLLWWAVAVFGLSGLVLLVLAAVPRIRLRADEAAGQLNWALTSLGLSLASRTLPIDQVESLRLSDPGSASPPRWPVLDVARLELVVAGSSLPLGEVPRAVALDVSGQLARKLGLVVEDRTSAGRNREAALELAESDELPQPRVDGLRTSIRREGVGYVLEVPAEMAWWTSIASFLAAVPLAGIVVLPLVPAQHAPLFPFALTTCWFLLRSAGLLAWRRRLRLAPGNLSLGRRRLEGPVRVRGLRHRDQPGRLVLSSGGGRDLVLRARVGQAEGRWLAALIGKVTSTPASLAP